MRMELEVDYEVVTISCLRCGHVNIYNKADDLDDRDDVAGIERPCQNPNCPEIIRIPMETANPPYELFLFDAGWYRRRKRHMQAVAMLAQAFEMFFALGVEVMLIHHPWNATGRTDQATAEDLASRLFDKTQKFAYAKMCSLFINLAAQPRPNSFLEAEALLSRVEILASLSEANRAIEAVADSDLRMLLTQLRDLPLPSLRNRVLHKRAYRPRASEVDECLKPAHELTSQLWIRLELSESLRGDGLGA